MDDNFYDAIFIGGGAASFFAALRCSELAPGRRYAILEKGKNFLQKVIVSGGGRCNVTNVISDPRELTSHYPRGSKALLGPFHTFSSVDTVRWFENRGVKIKAEADGRMFPVSNRSADIANALLNACEHAGIELYTSTGVKEKYKNGDGWTVKTKDKALRCRLLFIGAGSSNAVWEMLERQQIRIVPPVPSLFTFNIKDPSIEGLAGLSLPNAGVKIAGSKLAASGPLLITHWGLSGPAVLRLSAWGARELASRNYRFEIFVNWIGETSAAELIEEKRKNKGKEIVISKGQAEIPLRLWKSLMHRAGISESDRWADLNKKQINALMDTLNRCSFKVDGKSTFKEEFVTAGGVDLKEVNFKHFNSRQYPDLFWAGEILDIDGITGGFNFQAAWTGAWIAGSAMGERLHGMG